MNYKKHFTTPIFLAKMRRHLAPYEVEVLGKSLCVLPNVFSPKYDWSGRFGVDCLPPLQGRSFLEIGSGCGIVSVFAALRGAKSIVSVDISPYAVDNTQINFEKHDINGEVKKGDLFGKIDTKFDVIFFNAPFHGDRATDWLEMAVSDENYRTLKKFLADAPKYLNDYGEIILGFSESGDERLLQNLLSRSGLKQTSMSSDCRKGYNAKYLTLRHHEAVQGRKPVSKPTSNFSLAELVV